MKNAASYIFKQALSAAGSKTRYQYFGLPMFLHALRQYENPVPGQTPLRIPEGGWPWDTVHGFKVDRKAASKYPDRKNFLFLKDISKVLEVMRRQWQSYQKNPGRFGLPENPTIGQALGKWDQTGAANSLKFLQQEFPWIKNLAEKPLKNLLQDRPVPRPPG